ncbi:HAD-IIB family hydrolase [Rariglobus hedericola]|uniref:beta-fructofuranosidase n=1 Tax=Rariglobus hedericola TaxID=2597822 RepID=A0A556QKP1_9BACT|nr:HAD-IIB family hydrolase [Rariglobus hedericola]TSJ77191.1 HAD-IIB family hydrolase [Rariglobus hedericola]
MSTESIRLFCSDIDNTLLGNSESARRFATAWKSLSAEKRPLLVYNSGRLVADMQQLVADGKLPAPDYYIGGVGTRIQQTRAKKSMEEFSAHIRHGWDLSRAIEIVARTPGIRPQPADFQEEFKSSWYLDSATPETLRSIDQHLSAAGIEACIVYSSNRDLDILPRRATKGGALQWLAGHLAIPLAQVAVAGDTGNDSSMFRLPGIKGIIVENALPELFEATVDVPAYCSRLVMADGVLDGLRHYGVIAELPSSQTTPQPGHETTPGFRMLFTGTRLGSLDNSEKDFLKTAYEKALIALRKNITPIGFSACSLEDNTVTGTDANYRSVWARDGAITVINTLDLDDADIRECQRRTLDTLLNAASPTGQIPANVRIDDGIPDYSGVGSICSIDSGLWVIIAFYNFVTTTGDHDFLRHHAERLQLAMNWLSAHDSNNDGLLEIPEAGDWTDLFGRSYNVLYDEVLWYRANVCYGRMLEFLGDYERATDYLRWSQNIRGRVLDLFWPSTAPSAADKAPNRFASRQFGMGDTQYLIAEITPFAFNWRCDVYANILAYLMNLLDADRARTAFRFMWGVGVNEPHPGANLYPVVQAGDPDWRAYYTVNLLNLPHHYHNGGIWPFIGGMWVRFIHRLGFHEVACRELVRLAKLNQLGRDQEWEFNEWAHGQTGRPMGKAYQAWSAACFIRACQEIEADPAHLTND